MAAYHIVYISRRIILKFIGEEGFANIDWWTIVFRPIWVNFITVPPLIILLLIATKIMIDRQVKLVYLIVTHFAFFLIYTLLLTAFAGILHYVIYGFNIMEDGEGFFISTLYGSNLNFLGYVGFVTIIYSYYYIQKTARMEVKEARLSQQLQNVKMQALKSQLNPHFLFNTLNTISSLIREDAYKAQQMIGNLGDLLREVLLVKDENMIPVNKEMIILNKYLQIMQTRFSDHLLITIEVDKKAEKALIPSMLIQPILENSFKYGYSYDSTNLIVDLAIFRKDKWLVVQIKNNGPSIADNNLDKGFGIANIQERLRTQFEDDFKFSFSNLENEKGVITSIKLPLVLV